MYNDEILAAIAAARKEGSFKLKLVFTIISAINQVRSFVTMLKGGGIAIDDDVMMKLRLVAISRRWQEDTDRVVVMTMDDNFDENKFVAKLEFAFESIEAVPRASPFCEHKDPEGTMKVTKAIQHARARDQRELKIVIPKADRTDIVLIWSMFKRGQISFTDPVEQQVFEEAAQNPNWSLSGRLSFGIRLEDGSREHIASGVLNGAGARVKTIKVMR